MAKRVYILFLDMGLKIMKMWVNSDGWLVTPYINAPMPGDFFEIELNDVDTNRHLNGTIFKYVDGKLVEHLSVQVRKHSV